MNKTISINLSGMLFNLEEAAYNQLLNYLQTIKNYFSAAEGRDEIIGDIESRIAELFQERLKNKQVILEQDVEDIIEIMGKPEVYAEEASADGTTANENSNSTDASNNVQESLYGKEKKRLFRDPDEGMLGGVCIGVGHYLGIDPVWLRIAFLVGLFFFGSGPLLYLILWIALPKAETTAEKLQMRGEAVTIESIEKKIKEEFERINKKAGEFTEGATRTLRDKKVGSRATNFLNELFEAILNFLRNLIRWMGRSFGVFLFVIGLVLFFTWLTAVIGQGQAISFNDDEGMSSFSLKAFMGAFFANDKHVNIAAIGIALFLLAPVIALLLAGIKLFFYPKFKTVNWPGAVNGGIFTIGLILCIVAAVLLTNQFRAKGKILESVPFAIQSADTLYVKPNMDNTVNLKNNLSLDNWSFYFNDGDELITGRIKLNVVNAGNENNYMTIEKLARGEDKKVAIKSAGQINTYVKENGNELVFNSNFNLKDGEKWRGQKVTYVLHLKENQIVKFDKNMIDLLWDIPNVQNLDGEEMRGETFKMTKEGLTCMSCLNADGEL
jgi:phage shock protein PspC (stress-responsive transcriptional regulator)